jgi:hypothetical protein
MPENARVSPNVGATILHGKFNVFMYFSHCTSYVLILTKMGLSTFWAIFSKNHLLTLVNSKAGLPDDMVFFTSIWSVCGHLVYSVAIWYNLWPFVAIFFCFGMLYQEKSGNPVPKRALFRRPF